MRLLGPGARLALGIAGLGLLIPAGTFPGAWWTDIGGLVLAVVVLGPNYLAKRVRWGGVRTHLGR